MTFYDFLINSFHNKDISKYLKEFTNLKTREICVFIQGGVRVLTLKKILDTKSSFENNDLEDFFEQAVISNRYFIFRNLMRRFRDFKPTRKKSLFFHAYVENKNWEIVLLLEEYLHCSFIENIPMHCVMKDIMDYKNYKMFVIKMRQRKKEIHLKAN